MTTNEERIEALERAAMALLHEGIDDADDTAAYIVFALADELRAGGERAQIVAWLREYGNHGLSPNCERCNIAAAIEAGAHLTTE